MTHDPNALRHRGSGMRIRHRRRESDCPAPLRHRGAMQKDESVTTDKPVILKPNDGQLQGRVMQEFLLKRA